MLFTYMRRVQKLLRDTKQEVLNPNDIIDFINEARVRLASETECLRFMGTLTLTINTTGPYAFSSITIPSMSGLGVAGILNVRLAWMNGAAWIAPRAFEWFNLYVLADPTLGAGVPQQMAQYAQGASGSLYFSPKPDSAYTVNLDCVCYPINLVDDTTVEAVPVSFTYAVPYYATYLAMLEMMTGSNTAEADKMKQRYMEYAAVARQGATPSVLPWQSEQIPVPGGVNQMPRSGQ